MADQGSMRSESTAIIAVGSLSLIVSLLLRSQGGFEPLSLWTSVGLGLALIGSTSLAGLSGRLSREAQHGTFAGGLVLLMSFSIWEPASIGLVAAGLIAGYVVVSLWCEFQEQRQSAEVLHQTSPAQAESMPVESEHAPVRLTINVGSSQSAGQVLQTEHERADSQLDAELDVKQQGAPQVVLDSLLMETEDADESEEIPADSTHWSTRSQANGCDELEGWERVFFRAGEKVLSFHVPFSPAFYSVPIVDCEPIESVSDVSAKVADVFTYGMKIDLRRSSSDDDEGVVIGFHVSAESKSSEAA